MVTWRSRNSFLYVARPILVGFGEMQTGFVVTSPSTGPPARLEAPGTRWVRCRRPRACPPPRATAARLRPARLPPALPGRAVRSGLFSAARTRVVRRGARLPVLLLLQRQQLVKLLHLLLLLVQRCAQQADLPVGGGGFELHLLDEPHLGTHNRGSGHDPAAPRRNPPSDSVPFENSDARHRGGGQALAAHTQRHLLLPAGIADSRAGPTQSRRTRRLRVWGL